MKSCPFCAEAVQDAAILCKHCGRDLVPATSDVGTDARARGVPPTGDCPATRARGYRARDLALAACAALLLGGSGVATAAHLVPGLLRPTSAAADVGDVRAVEYDL